MASITVEWPSKEEPTKKDVGDGLILGRSKECEIAIDDDGVSAKHAWVRKVGDRYLLIDLRSTNGITINDELVEEQQLHDGDKFCLCDVVCYFEDAVEKAKGATGEVAPLDSPVDQCPSCGYLVPGHLDECPRCKKSMAGVARSGSALMVYDLEHTRKFVRAMSSLAFAGGLVGPLLLGVGWAIGIVLGIMVLAGYRSEANADDRRMAFKGILLGFLWMAIMLWAVHFFVLRG